jgi:LytS/YehU family sensor histidine kinase
VLYPQFFPERTGTEFFVIFRHLKTFTNTYTLAVMVIAIKLLKKWYYDQQEAKSLEKEKLEAELKFLKAQVHPHFLFNTLNNLYSLTLKKSDNAPEVVLKLSELMSYMLYDTAARQVSLSKEINYINHYIDLEKIRYAERLDVSFNTSGDISAKMIAPMLLLPFIENSFKHGVSGELETVWVSLDLHVEEDKLIFKVENSKSPEEENIKISSYRSGIGLKNVRRRLDLIYANNYDLKIFDEKDTFLVVLKLKLATVFENLATEIPSNKVLQD